MYPDDAKTPCNSTQLPFVWAPCCQRNLQSATPATHSFCGSSCSISASTSTHILAPTYPSTSNPTPAPPTAPTPTLSAHIRRCYIQQNTISRFDDENHLHFLQSYLQCCEGDFSITSCTRDRQLCLKPALVQDTDYVVEKTYRLAT